MRHACTVSNITCLLVTLLQAPGFNTRGWEGHITFGRLNQESLCLGVLGSLAPYQSKVVAHVENFRNKLVLAALFHPLWQAKQPPPKKID
jgi:hypothetical protein